MAALCKLLPQGLLLAMVVLAASKQFLHNMQSALTVDHADSLKHIYD